MSEVSYVYMETIDGQRIQLELIDVQQEKIGETVQIVGKSYDIFAVPIKEE